MIRKYENGIIIQHCAKCLKKVKDPKTMIISSFNDGEYGIICKECHKKARGI